MTTADTEASAQAVMPRDGPAQSGLFKRAEPLSPTRHPRMSVAPVRDYSFAEDLNAMPLAEQELAEAALHSAIVFVGSSMRPVPACLMGLQAGQNDMIDAAGNWRFSWMPLVLKQYPFVVSDRNGEGRDFVLCIDLDSPSCDPTGENGEPLFEADRSHTPFLKAQIVRSGALHGGLKRASEAAAALSAEGLLQTAAVEFDSDNGRRRMRGFETVDFAALDSADDASLARLHKSGALEMVYHHRRSLERFRGLRKDAPS